MARPRIVVTMTTSPRRMELFKPVIDSILEQSLRPDAIHLNLPEFYRNTTRYRFPRWLSGNSAMTINVLPEPDLGPAMKLIPALVTEPNPETILITIDDDVLFPTDAIRSFVDATQEEPNTAFCSKGFRFEPGTNNIVPVRGQGSPCDVLQGFSGCCYRRSHFKGPELQLTIDALPEEFRINDDVILSNHIARSGIKRKTINFQEGKLKFTPWSDEDPDALKSVGPGTHARYQELRQYLEHQGLWHIRST